MVRGSLIAAIDVRTLPEGKPASVAELANRRPVMTTLGRGLYWASDGTVFVATDVDAGLALHLDPAGG